LPTVLLLFDSRGGLTEQLAEAIASGVSSVPEAAPRYRRLDEAGHQELKHCDAFILGSLNWSGMTGKLKDWIDYSGDLWESGELAGKVGAALTAGYSRSAGTEATLLQRAAPAVRAWDARRRTPFFGTYARLRLLPRRDRAWPGQGGRSRAGAGAWAARCRDCC